MHNKHFLHSNIYHILKQINTNCSQITLVFQMQIGVFLNGAPLEINDNTHTAVIVDGTMRRVMVIFDHVLKEHAGVLRITATNSEGSAYADVGVDVAGMYRIRGKPRITFFYKSNTAIFVLILGTNKLSL